MTVAGIELELDGINPAKKWAEQQNNFKRRVRQQAPMQAQTKNLAAKVDTNVIEGVVASLPLKRMGEAKEIASVVLFLASDLAAYVTGQVVGVDGGMAM